MEAACSRALDLDVISVTKVASMLARATEHTTPDLPAAGAATGRFARQPGEFATTRTTPATAGTAPASTGTAPASTGSTPATAGTSRLTLIHGGADAATPERQTTS